VVTDQFKAIARAMVKAQNQAEHPLVIVPVRTNMMSNGELDEIAVQTLREVFGLEPDGPLRQATDS
jgi:hypothetical protein